MDLVDNDFYKIFPLQELEDGEIDEEGELNDNKGENGLGGEIFNEKAALNEEAM